MSNQNRRPVVDRSICNAESVLLSDIFTALDAARSSVLHLQTVAGLSANSSGQFERDRWEMTQGKIYALNQLEDAIKALPAYLMGEKPDLLSILEFERARFRRMAIQAAGSHEQDSDSSPSPHELTWFRAHCISEFLSDFLRPFRPFPGNAEEQPGPREESPASIGEKPCDDAGGESSFPVPPDDVLSDESEEWVSDQSSPDLCRFFEAVRSELESRGVVLHWSISGI
jgi:hypothetical protein